MCYLDFNYASIEAFLNRSETALPTDYEAKGKPIMKEKILCLFLFVFFASCNLNKPVDYYNKAVYAGNGAITMFELENRLERLESGMTLAPEDLNSSSMARLSYCENMIADLKDLLGNEDSDPMIKATIAYVNFGIQTAKNPKTLQVFEAVGNAANFEEASIALEPLGDYLDGIYDQNEVLYMAYDKEVSAYAKKNNIEMKFYGPGASTEN